MAGVDVDLKDSFFTLNEQRQLALPAGSLGRDLPNQKRQFVRFGTRHERSEGKSDQITVRAMKHLARRLICLKNFAGPCKAQITGR